MLPLTLLATNKFMNILAANNALSETISASAAAAGVDLAPLNTAQIYSSFLNADLGDLDLQLTYPRICLYAAQGVNNQREKFRAFSGFVALTSDVWSSASLEQDTEMALHFYADGVGSLLRENIGDWGDGFRYSGIYDLRMQTPKVGGLGFVQLAKLTCNLDVSFS